MNLEHVEQIRTVLLNSLLSDPICRESTAGEILSGAMTCLDHLLYSAASLSLSEDRLVNRETVDAALRVLIKHHGLTTN